MSNRNGNSPGSDSYMESGKIPWIAIIVGIIIILVIIWLVMRSDSNGSNDKSKRHVVPSDPQCSTKHDCHEGEMCLNGLCVDIPDDFCFEDCDCCEGKFCKDHKCKRRHGSNSI